MTKVSRRHGGIQEETTKGNDVSDENDGDAVRVLVPKRNQGNENGDAFLLMRPPPWELDGLTATIECAIAKTTVKRRIVSLIFSSAS